jgi:hypothetical protein
MWMLGRTLRLATVTLLIGCFAAGAARAQVTNLEAGKTPSQIFAGTCNACHKSPRGLLKTVAASSLPGYLRQHYTTSSDMASVLSSFLVSNGATDTRYQAKDAPKQGKDAKPDAKPVQEAKPAGPPDQLDRFGRRLRPTAPAQEAAKPDADGIAPQAEPARPGRDAKRLARPAETPDTAKPADGQTPAQAATDSKLGAKQKLSKRGKPSIVEEPPKPDEAAKDEASKSPSARETAKSDAVKDATKDDADKPEAAKPAGEGKSDTAKVDAAKESVKETVGSEPTALRHDPVPPVTPAPPASATTAPGTSEPAASSSPSEPSTPSAAPSAPAAVTASAPPAPPVAPAGPPAPPISQ